MYSRSLYLAIFVTSALGVSASSAYVQLVPFTPDDDSWQTVNDPVMGGESSSGIIIDCAPASGGRPSCAAVWDGTVRIVPFLHAAGFCVAQTKPGTRFPDATGYTHLDIVLRVNQTLPYNLTSFQAQVTTESKDLPLKCHFFGPCAYQSKAFKATSEWSHISLPLDHFLPSWRGQPVKGPPLSQLLGEITQIGFSVGQSPNAPGPFHLEIESIGASNGPENIRVVHTNPATYNARKLLA